MALNVPRRQVRLNFTNPEYNEDIYPFLSPNQVVWGVLCTQITLGMLVHDPRALVTFRWTLGPGGQSVILQKHAWQPLLRQAVNTFQPEGGLRSQHQAAANCAPHIVEVEYVFPDGITASCTPFSNHENRVAFRVREQEFDFGEADDMDAQILHVHHWSEINLSVREDNETQVAQDDDMAEFAAQFGAVNLGAHPNAPDPPVDDDSSMESEDNYPPDGQVASLIAQFEQGQAQGQEVQERQEEVNDNLSGYFEDAQSELYVSFSDELSRVRSRDDNDGNTNDEDAPSSPPSPKRVRFNH